MFYYGNYLRNIAVVPDELDDQIASTAYCVLRPKENVESRFLFYQLIQERFINSVVTYGNSPPSARDDEFLSMEVTWAPLEDQKRIVARIESLFSKLDAGVEALKRVRVNLKRYRASLLKAAVEGRLTEQWRKEHPDVEPASELLKRILKERRARWIDRQLETWKNKKQQAGWPEDKIAAALPKEKEKIAAKYKSPAPPSEEFLAQAPPLPETWAWVTGEQLFRWSSGEFLPKTKMQDGSVPVYGGNGINGYHDKALVDSPTVVVGRVGFYCGNVHVVEPPAWVTDNAVYAVWAPSSMYLSYFKTALTQSDLVDRARGG